MHTHPSPSWVIFVFTCWEKLLMSGEAQICIWQQGSHLSGQPTDALVGFFEGQ